jgi:DNA-binding response OmpR family regulator
VSSVLIIDDDPVIQLLLRVNFEQDGFQVETAGDGQQGVEKAREMMPDLILLDVLMPKMDGFEVLKALRSDPRTENLRVALLSAKSSDSDQKAGMAAGADAYMTKPFDPLQLLDDVRRLIAAEPEPGSAPN